MTDPEIWRRSPSNPDLMVSSHGRVMVIPYSKPMPYGGERSYGGVPTYGQWDGERYVYTRRGKKTLKVARLVCEAFNGPPDDGQMCLHEDEDSRNNRPDNLRWGTNKENLNYPGYLEYCRSRIGHNSPVVKGRIKRELTNP